MELSSVLEVPVPVEEEYDINQNNVDWCIENSELLFLPENGEFQLEMNKILCDGTLENRPPTEQEDSVASVSIEVEENINIADPEQMSDECQETCHERDIKKYKLGVNKKKRELGLAYNGKKKEKDGNWNYRVPRAGKSMKKRCNCKLSKMGSTLKCGTIDELDRQKVFNLFWKTMTWEQRRTFVSSLIETGPTKDQKNRQNPKTSRRKTSLKFYLPNQGGKTRVCKLMFLRTIGMSDWFVLQALKETQNYDDIVKKTPSEDEDSIDGRKHLRKTIKVVGTKMEGLHQFLDSLPKMESHYCRKNTNRLYFLEPLFQTKTEVYKLYKKHCLEKNIPAASLKSFYNIFEQMRLSIYTPRKDQCDLCVGYKENTETQEKYDAHQKRKRDARLEKENDENRPNTLVFTMDMQGVLLSPYLKASSLYYKMKLCVHNFTIFHKRSKDVSCYLWHEGEGGITSNEITSIITNFIEGLNLEGIEEIIFWSDGCGYQNRNVHLTNALLLLSQKLNITITQKYLEKGHTQMECDSIHAHIERKLKNKSIHSPAGYIDIIETARNNPYPYKVKYLDHKFFKDFSKIKIISSIRPGLVPGDPTVNCIKALKYSSGGLFYKMQFGDNWDSMPRRLKKDTIKWEEIPLLHLTSLKIKPDKFKHLQQLKSVIAKDYHSFYDQLRH